MNDIANRLTHQLVTARCCDALEPCGTCSSKRTRYAAVAHAERVATLTLTPWSGSLRDRLASA